MPFPVVIDIQFQANIFRKWSVLEVMLNYDTLNTNATANGTDRYLLDFCTALLHKLYDEKNFPEFLWVLCIQDGMICSAKNRTNLRDSTALESINNQPFGFKRALIRLIGNLCYQHCDNKNKV